MKVRSVAVILTLLMIVSVFTACGKSAQQQSGNNTANDKNYDPNSKYDNTVVVSIGRDNPTNVGYPEGDTVENNQFINAIKDRYNIEVKYGWLASANDYDAKVNLAISSGDIPDVMVVNKQSQVKQLVDADMVEDLKTSFNKTASKLIKDRFGSFKDQEFATGLYDGKLLALPNNNIGYQFNLLWVRQDWLQKVGAQPPKTLDDVINLSKTFIEKDPGGNGAGKTIGLTANSSVAGNYATKHSLDPIFAVYNSFPRQWVKNASGKYTYGTTLPETKAALAKIADLYKSGLIDKGFATSKVDDEDALIISGKAGMMFGPWYMGNRPLSNSVKNNPNADWIAVQAPLDSKGVYNVQAQNPHSSWIVVKKGYKNPEAVFKILNFDLAWFRKADPEISKVYAGKNIGSGAAPIPFQIEYQDIIPRMYAELKDAVNSNNPSKLDVEEKLYYDSYTQNKANPKADLTAWANVTSRFVGMSTASLPVKIAPFGFPGTTKTMETKLANLKTLEDQALLKIVLGSESINYFDTFVEQWKQQGGDEITKEVNEALK